MSKNASIFLLAMIVGVICHAQTRFFEFTTICGHGNWQDTSFIAATSNPVLIDTVLANLARPMEMRKFINGPIAPGHGGHNHNAGHLFLWHFIPDQWDLVEMAIELCDGCPYSDVDADTLYWIQVVGQFCPWSSKPVREVGDPALGMNDRFWENGVLIAPNPAAQRVQVTWPHRNPLTVEVFDQMRRLMFSTHLEAHHSSVDISGLANGLYHIRISDGHRTVVRKLIVESE
jgi:hypothetical protein